MSHRVAGGCLCGRVRFTATLPSHDLSVCWCTQCLRQNSGPLVSTEDAETWEVTGEVAGFRASDTATRGFCADCGSTIFWQGDGEAPGFALGALDLRDGYRVTRVLHEDTRPDAFAAGLGGTREPPAREGGDDGM